MFAFTPVTDIGQTIVSGECASTVKLFCNKLTGVLVPIAIQMLTLAMALTFDKFSIELPALIVYQHTPTVRKAHLKRTGVAGAGGGGGGGGAAAAAAAAGEGEGEGGGG
jgi:hypothetical protein